MQDISKEVRDITSITQQIDSLHSLLLAIKTSKKKKEQVNTLLQNILYEAKILLGIIDALMQIKERQNKMLMKVQKKTFKEELLSDRDIFRGVYFVYYDLKAGTQYDEFPNGEKTDLKEVLYYFIKNIRRKNFKKRSQDYTRIKFDDPLFTEIYDDLREWRKEDNRKRMTGKVITIEELKVWEGGNISIENLNKRIRGGYNAKNYLKKS